MQDNTSRPGPEPGAPEFLTPADLMRVLRLSRHNVYDCLNRGDIPGAAKIGGSWRVRRADLDRMFEPENN